MPDVIRVPIKSDLDIVSARVEGRNLAKDIGFGLIDQARIATAISELARNVILYAGTGTVLIRRLDDDIARDGIEIVCEDHGPGIEDLEVVMSDGYSSSRGLGMGLPGTKRLMDEFDIQSTAGGGTVVLIRKWLRLR